MLDMAHHSVLTPIRGPLAFSSRTHMAVSVRQLAERDRDA
jgi:hypothetical protein